MEETMYSGTNIISLYSINAFELKCGGHWHS